MPVYYLIKNDALLGEIHTELGSVVALPLIQSDDAMSLMDSRHVANLCSNLELTPQQALAALGLQDFRGNLVKTVCLTPVQIRGIPIGIDGPSYHLIDVGGYALWEVDSNVQNLIDIHNYFYGQDPVNTLGMLAAVDVFGVSFKPSAVKDATGMTNQQWLSRRDRIATYLESLGKDATLLRQATNEHALMVGIVDALGFTMPNLWSVMVEA